MVRYGKEFLIWESEPYRVVLRDNRYFIQANNICYQQYIDICCVGVDDKLLAVLIAIILYSDYYGLSINHRSKDVYHADVDANVREHLFTFDISEALGVECKEVTE